MVPGDGRVILPSLLLLGWIVVDLDVAHVSVDEGRDIPRAAEVVRDVGILRLVPRGAVIRRPRRKHDRFRRLPDRSQFSSGNAGKWRPRHRAGPGVPAVEGIRSEEHTSELQSPHVISYAVF